MNDNINKTNIVKLLSDLVNIYSPYFHEGKIVDYVHNWFSENNIDVSYHSFYEKFITGIRGRNVIGTLEGSEDGPTILLNGHLDTIGITQNWTYTPTSATVKGNRLYGLGALDMKSGCAAIMLAVRAFKEEHENFKGKVVFSLVSGEEGPYGLGTNSLIVDKLVDDVDLAIITEPSSAFTHHPFPCLCLGARGGYNYRVTITGKSAHAANPDYGVDAIGEAAKVVLQLKKMRMKKDKKLGKGSICILNINSSDESCSVADSATFTVFRHTVRGEDKEYIKREIEKAIKKANIKGNYSIEFRTGPTPNSDGFEPYVVSEDNSYVRDFRECVYGVTGKQPQISYFSSVGDFNSISTRLGIPTLVFGPNGENYHTGDEFVYIDTVLETAKVIYSFLTDLLVNDTH